MTHKIIIDTDPGIDDAMAVHLALAHPGLEVLGLTSVFGNVPAERPRGRPHTLDAADFIVQTLRDHPRVVTLVPLGPLTNIALALRRDPSIAGKVRGVVLMGGAVWTRGNVSESAEANIWHDPHAAAEVLAADWPVTLVGLDVTERPRCRAIDFARIADQSPVIGGFLDRAAQSYFGWHRKRGIKDGCFLHDPSAVLAAAEPALFGMRRVPVRVVTQGGEIGRTLADPQAGTPPVSVCTGVDAEALRERFLSVLMTADGCRAARTEEGAGLRQGRTGAPVGGSGAGHDLRRLD